MNNTKRTLAVSAILMGAILVVGGTFVTTTTTTQLAFAVDKKGGGGQQENSKNGNTVTALKCQNIGSASGFDTAVNRVWKHDMYTPRRRCNLCE